MGFDPREGYRAGGRGVDMDDAEAAEPVSLTVRADGTETTIEAERGAILRDVLSAHGFEVIEKVLWGQLRPK
jgi:hypothetical protein